MTLRSGLHIHPLNDIGTSAQEARQALAGLVTSAGVLDGLTVTGTAGWQYRVAAGHVATSRGVQEDGVVLFANDSPVLVDCTPAPGTGARIDVIYAKHNDAEKGDTTNLPVIEVAEGIASGSPVAPELPVGAVEVGRATVGAGATNTSHANVTISHGERPRTAARGGMVSVASAAQRDAAYQAAVGAGASTIMVWREDLKAPEVYDGTAWRTVNTGTTVAATVVSAGSTNLSQSAYVEMGAMTVSSGTNFGPFSYTRSQPDVYGSGLLANVAGTYRIEAWGRFADPTTQFYWKVLEDGVDTRVVASTLTSTDTATVTHTATLQAGQRLGVHLLYTMATSGANPLRGGVWSGITMTYLGS